MSNLINLDNVSLDFGVDLLLDNVKLQITTGERICLIGRNGAGKSSLLKVIDGTQKSDSGSVWRKPNLRLARLEQELPQNIDGTIYEFVAEGLSFVGKLLSEYHVLTHGLTQAKNLAQLEKLHNAIEANNGWQFDQNISIILSRLDLDPDKPMSQLSGGWQRRAALAKALVISPELLLLDEPTNHLDIDAIQWLEDQLLASNAGLLFITHDRSLLQRLATRIIELDRGQLTSWPGDYANFLRRKDELLNAETQHNKEFDRKLAQEEVWIRQGVKARRTRNEGRVYALKQLRLERSKRREVEGKVSFNTNIAEKSGQLVIAAKSVNHSFGEQAIIKNFTLRIMRGDRIGLVGPNGIGKSTLLNILLGKLMPQSGTVKLGLEKTVLENVAHGCDTVEINGKKRHVISYLSDFLFTPARTRTPAKALSGGECNRLLLARLFSQPANVFVLDEPTNDLDLETLELLEELLSKYEGTLLLVSHDREFLDNVVTSMLVFTGDGNVIEYIGGYSDWQREARQQPKEIIELKKTKQEKIVPKQQKKLSYKDQRLLDELPKRIEEIEAKKSEIEKIISDQEFYKKDAATIKETMSTLQQLELDLKAAYDKWEALER